MRTATLLLLTLSACVDQTSAPRLGESASALAPGSRCFDPADFGGIPNDGIDDRLALQGAVDAAALAGGGTVCPGPGRWSLRRAPAGSYNRLAGISTHSANITIRGAGPDTVIEALNDSGGTFWVIALDPGAQNIRIADLTIDTSLMTNTDEQTHAIEVGSNVCVPANNVCPDVTDVKIDNVRFVHPNFPGFRKGDCLRLAGTFGVVRRVTVIGSTFTVCARSGIGIQRNVVDLSIVGNQFTNPSDQDIDAEPTGAGINDGLVISGNVFNDARATSQGDWAVTVVGLNPPYSHVTVSNNVFKGRGLDLYRVADLLVTGNSFDSEHMTGYGTIESENTMRDVVIANNVIRRRGFAGPAIRIMPHSGQMPSDFNVTGNHIINETAGHGIYMEGATSFSVTNNSLRWTVPADIFSAIYLRTTVQPADNVVISGNRVSAPALRYGLLLGAAPNTIGDVTLVGNQMRGAQYGLYCNGASTLYLSPVVSTGNRWGTVLCNAAIPFSTGN